MSETGRNPAYLSTAPHWRKHNLPYYCDVCLHYSRKRGCTHVFGPGDELADVCERYAECGLFEDED